MRRSICYCEPSVAKAGDVGDWKFLFTTANELPKGTKLKFDLMSKGREVDWQIPEVDSKKRTNVIYLEMPDGKSVNMHAVEVPDSWVPQFECSLPKGIEAGETIAIVVGSRGGKANQGNVSQKTVQRRRAFHLYVDTKGKGAYDEPEVFLMDVRGNDLDHIRVFVPSFVGRNRRFDVVVRFEDAHGNLTSNAPEDTLIELSHEHLRENLNWKLFVPETGFITLPNLYFNEEGVYTITLRNLANKRSYKSAPIRCLNEATQELLWGCLHGESERVDSTENIETCLRHFRDEKAYNFYGVSSFEDADETPNDLWKHIAGNIADFNEEDRFATFLGYQYVGSEGSEGVRQIVLAKDNKPIMRKKDAKSSSLKKLYRNYNPGEMISIPCFTMGKGYHYDFKNFDPDFERVVEIYNAWGCSERTAKQGNSTPITAGKRDGVKETAEGSVLEALKRGLRFGFVAGGLDDRGFYGDLYESSQEQYHPGFTAIVTKAHSRDNLIKALYQRSCYATTGARIIMGLFIAGVPMGSETSVEEKPGLAVNRHLNGYVAGTDGIHSIEVVRNGEVVQTFKPEGYRFDFEWDDMTPINDAVLKSKEAPSPFCFYYIRVTQNDGHMAWSSPIWVDLHAQKSSGKK